MLIEELIRLGRPLIEGGLDAIELLGLVTDVGDARVRNFYRHVFVVELPAGGESCRPAVLPLQVWGQPIDDDFRVESARAIGAPISLPSGGNPLNPQGRYGLPVYPCWDAHFQAFRASAQGVIDFLRGRVQRTLGLSLSDEAIQDIAGQLHDQIRAIGFNPREKWLGIIILAQPTEGGVYGYVANLSLSTVGASVLHPGRFIAPVPQRILDQIWAARFAEGAEQGRRSGSCSFSGDGEEVVAPYCTAWPWALLTWTCPLPMAGRTDWVVEGIGLDERSYRALIAGASAFRRLTRLVHPLVVHELFSMANDREGRNLAGRRKLSDLAHIYGSAFLLPLQDRSPTESGSLGEFASGMRAMLEPPSREGPLADRYLDSVLGFESFLPPEVDRDDYRLTLVYFSGEPSRGDVHLRSYIQDVIPSTLQRLKDLVRPISREAVLLLRSLNRGAKEGQVGYIERVYQSLPYMLARAFGGSHLWGVLEQVLHRRPLDHGRFTANAAARMSSLVARWPKSRSDLLDEVIFYQAFRSLLERYDRVLSERPAGGEMPMRPWKELLRAVENAPIAELDYQSVAELGFGCGAMLRKFSRRYWQATKVGKEGKDYLRHRVLTFGADLSPELVQKQGLKGMFEVSSKNPSIKFGRDLQERVGHALTEFHRLEDQVRAHRDDFMTAFWSGYALQGFDRPRSKKPPAISGVQR
jgi:hypothetical protein